MAKKEVKENKNENSKNKKSFSKDFKAELKKVIWPTPKQLLNNTIAVITIVLITAIIVCILDLVFKTLNEQGVDKIKEVVTSMNTTQEQNTENEQSNTQTNGESLQTDEDAQNIEVVEDSEQNNVE